MRIPRKGQTVRECVCVCSFNYKIVDERHVWDAMEIWAETLICIRVNHSKGMIRMLANVCPILRIRCIGPLECLLHSTITWTGWWSFRVYVCVLHTCLARSSPGQSGCLQLNRSRFQPCTAARQRERETDRLRGQPGQAAPASVFFVF